MASRKRIKKQSKLNFSPLSPSTRQAQAWDESSWPNKKRRIEDYLQQQVSALERPSSSAARASLPSPFRTSQPGSIAKDNVPIYNGEKDGPDEGGSVLTDSESDTSFDSLVLKTPRKKSEKQSQSNKPAKESSRIFTQPSYISPKRKHIRSPESAGSDEQEASSSSSDSDDPIQLITPTRRRLVRGSSQRTPAENDGEDDSDSDILPALSQNRRRLKRGDSSPLNGGGNSPDPTPVRSRRTTRSSRRDNINENLSATGSRLSSPESRNSYEKEKQDEIDEDAEDLRTSTVFRDDLGSSRPSKRDDRRKMLEQLKAKRAGTRSSPILRDPDNDPEYLNVDDEDEDGSLQQIHPLDEDDEDLDDWVVQGEEGDEGDDEINNGSDLMPLEMMRHGRRELKEHWKYVMKWMLQSRLNPGGADELKELYQMSIMRVNKECQGLVDRLVSSAWVPTFTRALKARPNYAEAPVEEEFLEAQKCSACNRSGHPAKFQVNLTGKAYDKTTLEPLKDDDDDDDDGDDSMDEDGNAIIDEQRDFMLGTFCRSNAMNAHALIHWRMDLKEWLNQYLKNNGYLKKKRIVEREAWSKVKRSKLIEEIMDELQNSGTIQQIWRAFKEKLSAAPNVQGQRYWK